jgi:gliding motility-associated-like protein
MKKLLSFFSFLLVSLLTNIYTAQASHMMGSDITWKCIGKDSYKVTVTVYRDCNGIPLGAQNYNLKACKSNSTISVAAKMSKGLDITPVCKKSCTRCKKGSPNSYPGNPSCSFQYGIEEFKFEGMLYIGKLSPKVPSTCCEITLSWGQCCRNGSINTGGAGADFYVEATLNRCAPKCDNSPYFTNPPVAIFCKGQCITFNMGVNDDDVDDNGNADSLVYFPVLPKSSASGNVAYSGKFKFNKPLTYDGFPSDFKKTDFNPPTCKGFFIDSTTGDINFKATKIEQTILAVQVQSWGKDASGKPVLKAVTRRDIQIILLDCKNNRVPTISGVNGTTSTDFEICAGQKKCFTINSYDPDTNDTVSVSWNSGIAGATFDIEKKKKHPVSTFCWEPGADKVRNYPYQFVVTAKDDACPINARTSKSFRVKVRPSPDPIITTEKIGCGTIQYSASPRAGSSITKYVWEGDDNLSGYTAKVKKHYRRGGQYRYNLNTTNSFNCTRRDSGVITIDPFVFIDLPRDSIFCQGDTSTVTIPSVKDGGTGPFGYKWNTASGDTDKATLSNIKIFRDSIFVITIFDKTEKCNNYDTIKYIMKRPYKPDLGPDLRFCFGTPVTIGDSFLTEKRLLLNWYKNVQATAFAFDTTITVSDSANYILTTVDSVGCKTSDSLVVAYNPSVDIVSNIFRGCKGDKINMGSGATDPNATFIWKLISKDGVAVNPPTVVNTGILYSKYPDGDEDYIVTSYQNKFGVTCSDSDTVRLIIKPKPKIRSTVVLPVCVNSAPLDLIQYVDLFGGVWSAKDVNYASSVSNGKFYPDKAKIGVNDLHYYYYNPASGCDTLLVIPVTVDPLPVVSAGIDSVICAGDSSRLNLYDLGAFPTSGGFWSGPGIFNNNFIKKSDPAIGSGRKTYIYQYTDNTKLSGCKNADTVDLVFVPDFYPNLSQIGDFCSTDADAEIQSTPLESDIFFHKYQVTDKTTGTDLSVALSKDAFGNMIFSPAAAMNGVAKGVDREVQIVLEVSNKGKCSKYDTISFSIYAKPEPSFNMSRTDFCISEGLIPLVAKETTGRRLFKSPAGKNYVSGNYFNTQQAGLGTHRVFYTYFDNSKGVSCPADTYIDLTVMNIPEISVKVKTACENEPFELTADTTNASAITWIPFDPTAIVVNQGSAKTLFYPGTNDIIAGRFRVMAKATRAPSTSPCIDDSVISVVIIPSKPKISFEADPVKGCEPLIVNFTDNTDFGNSLPNGYVWDFGDGTSSTERNPSHAYVYDRAQSTFSVTLKVRSAGDCLDTLIKPDLINVYPMPIADFVATPRMTTISLPIVRFEDKTDYKDPRLQDDAFLVWSFGDGKTLSGRGDTTKMIDHEYKDTGVYTVSLRVRNQYGCPDTIIKSGYIDIRPEILVFIPNVFTPNGIYNDKTISNEQFLPIVTNVSNFNLHIFSRWGEFLFESNDQTKGWDGNFKGKMCQDDAYVYVLKVTSLTGKKYKYTGSVTLIK